MPVATLADLKAHLDITGDVDEAELQNILDAAIEVVEATVGPQSGGTYTETYGIDSDEIVLRRRPVASVVTVVSRSATLSPAAYEVDAAMGIVRSVGGWFYGYFTVTYTVGWAVVPAPIRLAALIIADQLYESQRMPGSGRFGARGGEPAVPTGFAVPNRAVELLTPYRHLGIA